MRAVLLALLGSMVFAAADDASRPDVGTLTLTLENDLFYNVDQHYTNGVRALWVPGAHIPVPAWLRGAAGILPWMSPDGVWRHGYAIGQSMFTPSDIRLSRPPRSDRPYAGWLYGTVGVGNESGEGGNLLDQVSLTLGVVGPASLAEPSQKVVHRTIAADRPRGWEHQLHNEPGIILTVQRNWREWVRTEFAGGHFDGTPHLGLAVGNVYTYANTGMMVRYGPCLPADYGPPRIQPGLLGSGAVEPVSRFTWYLFAGVEGRAVAYNIFLDGNTLRDSRDVERIPWVGEAQFGLVLDWPACRLSYTHVLRTREFRGQDDHDNFGALSLSLTF